MAGAGTIFMKKVVEYIFCKLSCDTQGNVRIHRVHKLL